MGQAQNFRELKNSSHFVNNAPILMIFCFCFPHENQDNEDMAGKKLLLQQI